MRKKMRYVDVQKNWRKIGPFARSDKARKIWMKDMKEYEQMRGWVSRARELPCDYDSCDWRYNRGPGRKPGFWDYVCHGACHWVVNLNLFLAISFDSTVPWRILTSDHHSTVWDGEKRLFDMNFLALEINPNEGFKMANDIELEPGEFYE